MPRQAASTDRTAPGLHEEARRRTASSNSSLPISAHVTLRICGATDRRQRQDDHQVTCIAGKERASG
jgi:hypothetical protein